MAMQALLTDGIAAEARTGQSFPLAASSEVSVPRKVILGRNADGYLEVFRVDSDGVLRHRFQHRGNGDWSAWLRFNPPPLTKGTELGVFEPGVAVANGPGGGLAVFAITRTGNAVYESHQREPNGSDWTPWTNLAVRVRGPLAASQNADGGLEVFARSGSGNGVLHLWQTNAEGGWSGGEELGGEVAPGLMVARNRDGRLELFGLDARSGQLVHCWQRRPGGISEWSAWSGLGGTIRPGFAIGQNARGVLEVFAVNRTTGIIQRICQASPGNSLEWSSWQDFGARVQDGVAVGQSADRRLEVLAVETSTGSLLHRWEILNDGSDQWSAWASMGKESLPYAAVGQNEDGNLEVFAADVQNPATLNHKRQISRASDWLDWSTMDHATFEYGSRAWQTDEGLPHNQVQALAQTRNGYLWVGTRAGLARFDGSSFTTFDGRNTPELTNASITALCAARDGTLWIGTEGGGLVRLRGGKFTRFSTEDGLAGNVLKVIYESRDGALWIGTTTGMSCYREGHFVNYTRREGLSSDVVSFIFQDRDEYLWVATGEGLDRLHNGTMEAFAMPNGLPNDSVRVICQDRAGRIWIGSNNGMLWYNAYWRSFFAYNTKYGLSDSFVSAICQDREGNLWVGTYSGLNRYREGRFFPELNSDGAPFDRVNALLEDRQGSLWVGSREGLARLSPKRFSTYTKRQGLSHNNVMAVLEDHQGADWFTTWGGGLNRLQDERVTVYATTNNISQTLLLSLGEGQDGSLWVGADFDGGLTRFKNALSTHYGLKEGLPNAPIRVIHEDHLTNLWVGTSKGLASMRQGRFKTYTVAEGLAGDAINALCEAPSGDLWVGTDRGLSVWRGERFTSFTAADGLPDSPVLAIYADREGSLWLGTRNAGLVRYHGGKFSVYTSRQGLFSDEIFDLTEDLGGWLWMTCSKGVSRVRKQELNDLDEGLAEGFSSIPYGKGDGFETVQCNGTAKPGIWRSRDGRLWFPTTKGVVTVDPATLQVDPLPPPVIIEAVQADRRPVPSPFREPMLAEAARSTKATSLTAAPMRLRVPPGRGELEFHYTALNLAFPESTRFKYKLEGVDSEWVEAGNRRVAHYNNIYPGEYRFQVQACNRDGVWNTSGAALALVIEPHFWETWWWRTALVLLTLGTAAAAARYVTRRRFHRKLRSLEQRHAIEKERGRIAKDIHDDLGSSLTRIMMLGERAEEGLARKEEVAVHVKKIVSSARATVQAMDEIVWAVNPENDTLEGLVEYLSHYADEFFESTTVSCRLEIPVQLPACTLAAEIRHDLFLIVKEAFNNVAKHAQATEVRVQVSANPGTIEIAIEDNGRGFVPGEPMPGRRGNGLGNMTKRAEIHSGRVQLTSSPGHGTKIVIQAPLPANARQL